MATDWGTASRGMPPSVMINVVPGVQSSGAYFGMLHASESHSAHTVPPPRCTAGKPVLQAGGWKDFGWAVLFWVHALVILGLAATLGRTALIQDMGVSVDDPTRSTLDFNSALFMRVIALACGVSVAMSTVMLWGLQRYAASLITCALYTSLVVQAALTVSMFFVNPIFGAVMAVLLLLTAVYVYYVRKRIPFAAAHMEAAVAVTRAHPAVYTYAFTALLLEAGWALLWAVAAFGLEHAINNAALPAASTGGSGGGGGSASPSAPPSKTAGGVVSFLMLLSLLWGAQLIKYTVHFVVADTVGHWWFEAQPRAAVSSAVKRAFTTSFGSLSFAAFIIAFLETLRRAARAVANKAREDGNSVLAMLACLAMCVIGCVESMAAYLNTYAIPIMALTGGDFVHSGKEALALFHSRGWEGIVNDDLVGDALRIASLMTASASALAGAGIVFIAMPHSGSRGAIAGVAGVFSFVIGFVLCSLMMSVLVAAVKAVFVAFAMDPAALGRTHPDFLAKLVDAWHTAHPGVWAQCGYAAAYGGGGGVGGSGVGGPGAYAPPAPGAYAPPAAAGPFAPPGYGVGHPPAGYPGQPLAQQGYLHQPPYGLQGGGAPQPPHAYSGAPIVGGYGGGGHQPGFKQGGYPAYQPSGGGYPPSLV